MCVRVCVCVCVCACVCVCECVCVCVCLQPISCLIFRTSVFNTPHVKAWFQESISARNSDEMVLFFCIFVA